MRWFPSYKSVRQYTAASHNASYTNLEVGVGLCLDSVVMESWRSRGYGDVRLVRHVVYVVLRS